MNEPDNISFNVAYETGEVMRGDATLVYNGKAKELL
jgi:hypothetical protein